MKRPRTSGRPSPNSVNSFAAIVCFSLIVALATLPVTDAMAQPAAPLVQLKTNGKVVAGQLIAVTGNQIVVSDNGSDTSISFDQTETMRFDNPPVDADVISNAARVRLIDGSRLRVSRFLKQDTLIEILLVDGSAITLRPRNVDFFRQRDNDGPTDEKFAAVIVGGDGEVKVASDGVVVLRSGQLQVIEGRIGDVTDDAVNFTVDDQTAEVKRERLDGFFFYHAAGRTIETPACELELVGGSTIAARSLESTDRGLSVTAVCGEVFELDWRVVARCDFSVGRSLALTDLPPATVDWTPLIASAEIANRLKAFRQPRIDESALGEPLALMDAIPAAPHSGMAVVEFQRGISIAGGGKISWRLGGEFTSLSGKVGFDPTADPAGVAELIIEVDGRAGFTSTMSNAEVAAPLPFTVDVADAERIVIRVNYADGRDLGDQLNLVELQLTR